MPDVTPAQGSDLKTLQQRYQQIKTGGAPEQPTDVVAAPVEKPSGFWAKCKSAVHGLDQTIADHPKTAVAAAAVAGGLIATKTPTKWLTHPIAESVGALEGAGVGVLGAHAALAHLPAVVPTLASALALGPGVTSALLTGAVVITAASVGRSIAKHHVEKGEGSSAPKACFMDRLRTQTLKASGLVVGGLIGAGLVAAVLSTATPALLAGAAVGSFGGLLAGPVASERGLNKVWGFIGSGLVVPLGAIIGYHLGMGSSDPGPGFAAVLAGLFSCIPAGMGIAATKSD